MTPAFSQRIINSANPVVAAIVSQGLQQSFKINILKKLLDVEIQYKVLMEAMAQQLINTSPAHSPGRQPNNHGLKIGASSSAN
jgi:hypothetical protein